MKHLLKLFVVSFVLAIAGRADAQVLTFDEMTPTENPILGTVVCGDTVGFRFSSAHFHLIGGDFLDPFTSNGTSHLGYEAVRGFPITMTRTGGGTFSLISLDAGEFHYPPQPDRPDAEMLTITGFQLGGGVVTYTLNIDGLRDGPGGIPDFEHFVLPNTFVNLTSVTFNGHRPGNFDGGIAIDNLEYDAGAPEVLPACVATPAVPPLPSLTITNPLPAYVAGTVLVAAVPGTNVTLASVQFFVDGVALGALDTAAPYQVSWDTRLVADGPHTITAEGRDAANNVGTASVAVTVSNTPGGGTTPHYIELDGVDDYVQVADAPGLSFGNGTTDTPLTIETWFRADAMGRHQLLGKWGETSNQEYQLQIVSGALRFDLRDNSRQGEAFVLTAGSFNQLIGTWHHLAVTYDGRGGPAAADGITMYVDGVAVALFRSTSATYVAMANLAAPLVIGREGPGWKQYDGGLDEIRLWNVARTLNELQATMATELTGTEPGLVGYWKFNEGSGEIVADEGPGDQLATLVNGPVWAPGGPLAPDVTAPEITGITTSGVTATSATVSFQTSEVTTAWVSYTLTTSCPCTIVPSAGMGTSHAVTLTALNPDTLYQFVVSAVDGAGNVQTSAPMTVRTLLASADAVPPTVALTSPVAGYVAGTVAVEATATDNVGVASVQFRVDGVALGAPVTAAPYQVSWDTTLVADGPHTITAEARDTSNNAATASVTVSVRNTPVSAESHFLELDGVDDYLQAADAPGLSFGNGTTDTPLTIETWFRPDAMGRHQLLGKWGESNNQEYQLHIVSGSLRFDLRDSARQGEAFVLTMDSFNALIGTWHHLAVTYDGRGGPTAADGITMYVDGVAVGVFRSTSATYVAMANLAAPLVIGREGPSWKQYDGGLDEIRLWNVARTVSQLQATMSTELTGSEPGLVGYWQFNDGFGTTAAGGTLGAPPAALVNGPVWVAGGPLAPDVTAPDITGITTSGVTATSATVSFQTSESATASVSYTATTTCPCTIVPSAVTGTSHSVTLTGLTADTLYHYVVSAVDGAGNVQTSAPLTVHTSLASSDAVPPTVALTSPVAGYVAGTVAVEATAADNVGVASVQFRVDGVALGAPVTAAPYQVSWDTTLVAEGPHTITAEARDTSNNAATASVIATVRNTPVSTEPHFLDLDGVDDYLQVADAPGLSFGNGTTDTPLTIETWFRPDAMGRHQLLGKWGESSNQEYQLHIVSGSLMFDLRDNARQGSASAFTMDSFNALIGTWHHLAVTYDGRGGPNAADGITIYVDGVAVGVFRSTSATYVAMANLAAPLVIGREGPGWKQYDGGLDEIRLWNVARTVSQLQATMSTELTGSEPGLVGYWQFNDGVGTTATGGTPGAPPAALFNGTAWVAGGPLAPDITAPDITGVVTSGVTATSATVSFQTSESATASVSYTPTTTCPCTDVPSAVTGTSHGVTLTGLAADTLYQFVVSAVDGAGNVQTSAPLTVHTSLASSDAVPPTVALTSPVAGYVAGTVAVEATAADNVGVASVQFRVDGVALGAPVTAAPYQVSWDTTLVAEGPHTITAEARDTSNNAATASVIATVRNTPVSTEPHFLDLDGVDDYLQVADAPGLSFGNGTTDTPLTIETWFRPDAMGRHQLLGKWGESSNQEYQLHIVSGSLMFDLRDNARQGSASAFTMDSFNALIGTWHHLAVTYDGRGGPNAADGITIYVDGVAVGVFRSTSATYVAMANLAAPLVIGREGPGWKQYGGDLDEIRLWNVARTVSQLQATMGTELTGSEPGLVGYWQFNDGVGTTATGGTPGTPPAALFNGTAWVAGTR